MWKQGSKTRQTAVDLLCDIVGGFLCGAATQVFSAPNGIAPGGVTGISVLINHMTDLPISALLAAINVPILLAAWYVLGRPFTLRTVKSVALLSLMMEAAKQILPAYQGDVILAALYGGVLNGLGVALVFMRGSTGGGTDVVARLLQKKFPGTPVGQLMLVLNGFILVIAALVYQNVENALYALISIYASSAVVDSVLYGLDRGKVLMIVTGRPEEIADAIIQRLGRGSTVLEGKGSYTHETRPVLMCAVRRSQVYEVKKLVFSYDPGAFIMAMEAGEIVGQGFKGAEEQNT